MMSDRYSGPGGTIRPIINDAALNETPQRSLAEIQAEAVEEFISKVVGWDSSFEIAAEDLQYAAKRYANQLRQQQEKDDDD